MKIKPPCLLLEALCLDENCSWELRMNQPCISSMFHSDEVNEEAVVFANWADGSIHEPIVPYRHIIAGSSLSWQIPLPDAIEILCSTALDGKIVTGCSATCINYKDFETQKICESFTC